MRVENGIGHLEGDITLANASQWLGLTEAALAQGATAFDLAGLNNLDSSALSLLLSLRRRAEAAGKSIEFRNVPESLASLAKLYGVAEQISSRSPGRPKNDLAPTGGGSGAFSEPGAQRISS